MHVLNPFAKGYGKKDGYVSHWENKDKQQQKLRERIHRSGKVNDDICREQEEQEQEKNTEIPIRKKIYIF